MKLFYNRTFKGHWPVGTSAVVVAATAEDAATALEDELHSLGLSQSVSAQSMIELEMKPQVVILQHGDY